MQFQYWFEMPNKWTFQMPKINHYLLSIIKNHTKILVPFAGEYRFNLNGKEFTYCDIQPNLPLPYLQGNIIDLLPTLGKFDLILSDPPYTFFQAHTTYKNQDLVQMTVVKELYNDHLENHGEIVHFGYNSTGLGKKRGYWKQELCVVNLGGGTTIFLFCGSRNNN